MAFDADTDLPALAAAIAAKQAVAWAEFQAQTRGPNAHLLPKRYDQSQGCWAYDYPPRSTVEGLVEHLSRLPAWMVEKARADYLGTQVAA